ncbi:MULTISPECIES: signal recognition particle protein [Sphingomonas]|uniref:Signal recognition particle protein n=1 Tax=Sphingomonas leidyi TaxID=68569 RepID=A0A7X5ZUD6_9SPHN|nr:MULTISPECIES: signal recognition particle protein [Sphingomonas]MBN8811502.1 signal recognition particle protein [Sphingomonas sp.]NIJ63971.1 signal recognition particle subunit SRP54 [Sphingomonas leidyi]OJY49764.1 MAG: signal recognition particle protein [Sphingomonas sp. 67-41]
MFESLSERLGGVFERLRGRGALTEADVRTAMREVRIALLEADVALPVARDFVEKVTEKAIGHEVLRSVTPGQQVVKIVHDALVDMLGPDTAELSIDVTPPAVIMLVGLQGSGKTTTTAKLSRLLKSQGKKVMMASLDVNRPAAQEQLAVLGTQTEVQTLPIVAGQQPVEIARRALNAARLQGYDVLMLDTAGRLHVDQALMDEMKAVADIARPNEILLVVDSLTGQDAVNVATSFSEQVPLTGVILTRMDGDARGGAALSMRAVTGKPIKFAGMGEKLDALEPFHPKRVAGRILGMGDVVSLVEKAAAAIQEEDAEKMAARLAKGQFDMNDLRGQLAQMRRMGGLGALAGMMPGMKKAQAAVDQVGGDKVLIRMDAMITSMTPKERAKPDLINAKRKIRIAKGSGTTVQDVNKLLKMHLEMQTAMKRLKKMGGLKGLMGMLGKGGPGGGMGGVGNALGGAGLGDMMGKLDGPGGAGGLPGLGGPGAPQLPPGFENFLKKK